MQVLKEGRRVAGFYRDAWAVRVLWEFGQVMLCID